MEPGSPWHYLFLWKFAHINCYTVRPQSTVLPEKTNSEQHTHTHTQSLSKALIPSQSEEKDRTTSKQKYGGKRKSKTGMAYLWQAQNLAKEPLWALCLLNLAHFPTTCLSQMPLVLFTPFEFTFISTGKFCLYKEYGDISTDLIYSRDFWFWNQTVRCSAIEK